MSLQYHINRTRALLSKLEELERAAEGDESKLGEELRYELTYTGEVLEDLRREMRILVRRAETAKEVDLYFDKERNCWRPRRPDPQSSD